MNIHYLFHMCSAAFNSQVKSLSDRPERRALRSRKCGCRPPPAGRKALEPRQDNRPLGRAAPAWRLSWTANGVATSLPSGVGRQFLRASNRCARRFPPGRTEHRRFEVGPRSARPASRRSSGTRNSTAHSKAETGLPGRPSTSHTAAEPVPKHQIAGLAATPPSRTTAPCSPPQTPSGPGRSRRARRPRWCPSRRRRARARAGPPRGWRRAGRGRWRARSRRRLRWRAAPSGHIRWNRRPVPLGSRPAGQHQLVAGRQHRHLGAAVHRKVGRRSAGREREVAGGSGACRAPAAHRRPGSRALSPDIAALALAFWTTTALPSRAVISCTGRLRPASSST